MKSSLIFRVKWKAIYRGEEKAGIEEEASWFMVDQRGNMYSHSPIRPVSPVDNAYVECEPLIKIGNKYMSVKEIEKALIVDRAEIIDPRD